MNRPGATGERLLALFALAVVLFNPPLLSLFSVDTALFGFPALYLYLFAIWGGVIALVAFMAHRRARLDKRRIIAGHGEDA